MTIEELIKKLQDFPSQYEVVEIKDGLLVDVKQVIGIHGNNKGVVFLSTDEPQSPPKYIKEEIKDKDRRLSYLDGIVTDVKIPGNQVTGINREE